MKNFFNSEGGGYRQFLKEGGGYFIENDYICDMEDVVLLKPASIRPVAFGDGFLDYKLSDILRESGEDLSFVCIAKTGVMVVYSATEYSHVKHFIDPLVGYVRADELRGNDAIIRYRAGDSKPVWVKLFVETLGVDLSVSQGDK